MALNKRLRSYLDEISFDPKLLLSPKVKYLTNIRIVALIMISIIVIGVASFFALPRRLNPEIKIPIVVISTVLPGAGPEDVESLVTIPIEDKVSAVKGIDTIQSVSQDNVSITTIQFLSTVTTEKAKQDVQSAVDSITDLPKDAKTPTVTAVDFENQPVWKFIVTTNSDLASLNRFAENLKDKLEDVSTVDRVTTSGTEQQEIDVFIKPDAVQTYGVDGQAIAKAVSAATSSYPAGSVASRNNTFAITIDPAITTIDDIRNTMVTLGTQTVKLGDIATIAERSQPNQTQSFFADKNTQPTRSIAVSVFKTEGSNIDQAVKDAQKVADDQIKPYNRTYTIKTTSDLSKEITDQFSDLIKNYRDTLILVFIVLFVFLGIRQAIIAISTIPLTFLVTFAIMQFTGITLNFLSLFALLLSLGLLVDDTIVVVTGMTSYYRTGKFTPTETGLLVWRDFIVPIWTTTITTVWAFLPLMLATGIIGEFIKTIPIVVGASLYTSTAVAVLITLPLMMIILKPQVARRVKIFFYVLLFIAIFAGMFFLVQTNPLLPIILLAFTALVFVTFQVRRTLINTAADFLATRFDTKRAKDRIGAALNHGVINVPKLARRYQEAVLDILVSKQKRRITVIIVIMFAIFSYLLVPFGFVVNEFFPKSDQDFLFVNLELPQGTTTAQANDQAYRLLNTVRNQPQTEYAISEAGVGAEDGGFGSNGGANQVTVTLNLYPMKHRSVSSIDIANQLRADLRNYQGGKVTVVEASGGPPAGADVQISLLGEDLQRLNQIADQVQAYLQEQPGVTNVNKSIKPGTSKIVFVPDKAKMADAGVTVDTVGFVLRTYASGFTLDDLKTGADKKQDIVFRTTEGSQDPSTLANVQIPTKNGPVPLASLGQIQLKSNPTQITRENKKRSITISAAVTQGYSVSKANQGLLDYTKKINLPTGYEWKTGGVNDENNKSVQSIFRAMIIAAILILITMVVQMQSYRKAVIVMLVIPLAISGVFIVFALTGTPLSFPALIGVLALFGIVVNNAMMIVAKINQNLAIGMDQLHATADAAASRLEPIMLGSICTIVGLIPITLSDPLWRGLGGAIIAGLLFSGIIMLFFIPTVYYMWYKEPGNK